jgi:hypothetical protein
MSKFEYLDVKGCWVTIPISFSTNVVFVTNFWPGTGVAPWYGGNPNPNSFVLPLNVTVNQLTNSVYRSPYAGPLAGVAPAKSGRSRWRR